MLNMISFNDWFCFDRWAYRLSRASSAKQIDQERSLRESFSEYKLFEFRNIVSLTRLYGCEILPNRWYLYQYNMNIYYYMFVIYIGVLPY